MGIDNQLVFAARRLITGANAHRINTLIFQYEQSVAILNGGRNPRIDPQKFERSLRDWVASELSRTKAQSWSTEAPS